MKCVDCQASALHVAVENHGCPSEPFCQGVERHRRIEFQRQVAVGESGIGQGCVGIVFNGYIVCIDGITGHMPVEVGNVDIRIDGHGACGCAPCGCHRRTQACVAGKGYRTIGRGVG